MHPGHTDYDDHSREGGIQGVAPRELRSPHSADQGGAQGLPTQVRRSRAQEARGAAPRDLREEALILRHPPPLPRAHSVSRAGAILFQINEHISSMA